MGKKRKLPTPKPVKPKKKVYRSIQFGMRLTSQERDKLEKMAQTHGMKASEYVRALVFGKG